MSQTEKVEVCFEIDKGLRSILEKQASKEKISLDNLIIDALYKRLPKMRGRITVTSEIRTKR
jgi:hypothetical protein